MSHKRPSNNNHGCLAPGVSPDGEHNEPIVRRFCAGDRDAVAALWREYGRPFTQRLQRQYWPLLAPDWCEQLTLDAMWRAWEHRATFLPEKGDFGGWLWRITVRRAAEEIRKPWFKERRREMALDPEKLLLVITPNAVETAAGDAGVESPVDLSELVNRAMLALSEVEHTVLLADMNSPDGSAPSGELGRQLGLASSTVRWHRARALAKLKPELLRLGYGHPRARNGAPG